MRTRRAIVMVTAMCCASGCLSYQAISSNPKAGTTLAIIAAEVGGAALLGLVPADDAEGRPWSYFERAGLWLGAAVFLDGLTWIVAQSGD